MIRILLKLLAIFDNNKVNQRIIEVNESRTDLIH